MDIHRILRQSYAEARAALVMGTSPAALARARERSFVKRLAARLGEAQSGGDIRVFSDYGRGNQADFGAERLLFDIAVCRVEEGNTARRKPESFLYIAAVLWQVEIEFAPDWRAVVQALNRLTGGGARNKLLVAAQSADLPASIAEAASVCAGELVLALLPHPADWDDAGAELEVWRMADGEWRALE